MNNNNQKQKELQLLPTKQREIIFTSSKRIKDGKVNHTTISEKRDIEKIKKIVNKLPSPKERKLTEISLRTNPRKWVVSLLDSYPDNVKEEEMESLLNDFSDSMQTRMREENKYAVVILYKNELVLCHSTFGEETITPNWKTIPRMLDSDNVLRYVRFIKEKNEVKVKYYERWATESFVDWLGLPQKDAFYHFGGKYRIYSRVDNADIVFELTEKDIDRWLEKHPEIHKGKITFSTPITYLKINQIRVGKKKYEDVGDFIQDLIAEKYGIEFYQRKFKEIVADKKSADNKPTGPLELYLHKFYDEKHRLVKIEGGESITIVEKVNPRVDILFVCSNIEIRSSYLEDIFARFINGEEINIIHAGIEISANPVTIKTLKIWNKLNIPDLVTYLINYYESVNLQDQDMARFIEYIIFKVLAENNKDTYIYHFLEPFAKKIIGESSFGDKLTKLEDKILEYKSQDYFSGKDKDIIRKLCEDLSKKLNDSPCKIYLIGVEDGGTFNTIPKSRLKSDRLEKIRQAIQNEINTTIRLIPILQNDKGILILVAG